VSVGSATALAQEHTEVNDDKIVKPQQANVVNLERFQLKSNVGYSRC
jgi:hypothetical protein